MDATQVRLSDHFLLSDLLGCDSVYRNGHANKVTRADSKKIREGEYLCEHLLERILEDQGPLSIGYGYVSPALSKHIVRYQDPNKPSYHRWDLGAACDIIVHDWVQMGVKGHEGDDPDSAPIYLAHWIDEYFEYSRMITYSESPYICVATRSYEPARRAFYENRYEGKPGAKPRFITKSKDATRRIEEGATLELDHDWQGQGWPSYHVAGRRGYEHIRLGRYVMLTDILYSPSYVQSGIRNRPPTSRDNVFWKCAADAALVLDYVMSHLGTRVSVVRGFESGGYNDWCIDRCMHIDIVLPTGVNSKEIVELVEGMQIVQQVASLDLGKRLQIEGKVHGKERDVRSAGNERRNARSRRRVS
jgi:hypothetical protein